METNAYWRANNYNLFSCQQAIVCLVSEKNTSVTQELQCFFNKRIVTKIKQIFIQHKQVIIVFMLTLKLYLNTGFSIIFS